MKRVAICPVCGAGVPYVVAWSRRGEDFRTCRACGARLRRRSTDRQPYTTLIVAALCTPVALYPLLILPVAAALGDWAVIALAAGATGASTAIIVLQWPYTNAFDPWFPRCSWCGYDLRSLPGRLCPECGGPPEVFSRREGHVRARGAEGSALGRG